MNSHFHRSGVNVGPTVRPGRHRLRSAGEPRRPEPILKLISQHFIALNFPSDCSFCFWKMAAVKIVWFSNFVRWKSAIVVYRLWRNIKIHGRNPLGRCWQLCCDDRKLIDGGFTRGGRGTSLTRLTRACRWNV